MKRNLIVMIVLMAVLALFVVTSSAQNPGIKYSLSTSKKITKTGMVVATSCALTAINLYTDGTHDATITLYDSATATTAGGVTTGPFVLFGGLKSDRITWPVPLVFKNGIYAVFSGTGDNATIEWAR